MKPLIVIIQRSKHKWDLVVQSDRFTEIPLQTNITLSNYDEAEKYLKNYLSGFIVEYEYKVIPWEKK